MRLVLYVFIFSQSLIFLSVFAEKIKKESSELDSIKWEKLEENKSKPLKKIIWKSYNDDEDYFQEDNQEDVFSDKNKNVFDENQVKFTLNDIKKNTQIESYIPLNNFLKKGDIDTTVQWKSALSGGAGGGTGHQNLSIRFDYGLNKDSLLSFYIAESDDPLFKLINNEVVQNSWSVFALGAKRKLFESKDLKNSITFASSLEYWIITSGKDGNNPSKSMFNKIDDTKRLDKFTELVSSLSIPYNRVINSKTTFALVPGVIFIPETLGNTINKNFYGNSFYLGYGLDYKLFDEFILTGSYTYLFGPGNNYFDENLKFSRKPIYSFGVNWNVNPIIGIEGKVTNGYGSTPSTGLLTIPSSNEVLYYLGASYKPYLSDTYLIPLKDENKLLKFGGLTVDNSILPRMGENHINIDYDSSGNLFTSYSYSLSNIFQLNLINAGSFKTKNNAISKNSQLSTTYLGANNFNYRVGGKLLFFSPEKNDLIWLSSKVSFGRDLDSRQGYIYTDLTSTMKLNNWLTFNISPKYIFSGVENIGALGFSNNINLSKNLQFIAETNLGITAKSTNNSTFSLRYAYLPSKSIDIFTTNSVGFQEIGTMLSTNDYKFGIRMNYIF